MNNCELGQYQIRQHRNTNIATLFTGQIKKEGAILKLFWNYDTLLVPCQPKGHDGKNKSKN